MATLKPSHLMTEEEFEEARRGWVVYYGRPEYGGWTRDDRDGRQKPAALIEEEKKSETHRNTPN